MSTSATPADWQLARLTMTAEAASLPGVLGLVRTLSAQQGLTFRAVERLAFVAEEACANIIDHAYPADERGTFDLLVLRRPGQLVIALEDQGLPFDFRAFEAEEQSSLAELLFRTFPGMIHCRSLGRRGNRIELVHDLPAATPLAHAAEAEISRGGEPPAPADAPLAVRLMRPEDAEGLTRCVYRTYGYTYAFDYLYDPEQVRQHQRLGLMHSVVAVNEAASEVVGHVALVLEWPDAKVGESGQAVVDPRYRGHHLFERMKDLLRQHAQALGMYGMFGEAVTIHPYSQKGTLALGAHETGVELAVLPATMSFKKIQEKQHQRQSLMLLYLLVGAAPGREVYPPPAHAALVRRIYEKIGLARTIGSPPEAQARLAGPSQVDVQVNAEINTARLQVRTAGPDLGELVRFRLRELCRRRVDWVGVDLPLSDAAAMRRVPDLEALGFSFCGVLPELADGDVLRLQYLNNVPFDPARVQVASDFGGEMLDYVVRARAAADGRR